MLLRSVSTTDAFAYAPAQDQSGDVTFTYRVSDGTFTSNTSAVTITVNAVNDAPVSAADAYTVDEDGSLNVSSALGVLANDTDVDSITLSSVLVAGPTLGTVTLDQNGSFTYAPNADAFGTDTFTYRANDGAANSNVSIVSVVISPLPDAPVAVADAFSADEDTVLTVPVELGLLGDDVDADGDALIAMVETAPEHGSLTLATNGSLSYVPAANYFGADTFTYTVSDGLLTSSPAAVALTVNPVNDSPSAPAPLTPADGATLEEGEIVSFSWAASTDIEGDALMYELTVTRDGTVAEMYSGSDVSFSATMLAPGAYSWTLFASDGSAQSSTVTSSFVIEADPGSGCACNVEGNASSKNLTPLLLAGLVLLRRRKISSQLP